MATAYLLNNTKASTPDDQDNIPLMELFVDLPLKIIDIERITDYRVFLSSLGPDDQIILAGGDGTLNRFVNDTEGLEILCEVLYFPNGTGNDFAREMGYDKGSLPFPVGRYLKQLPVVEVKNQKYRFLNGVGYGIDGYCCQVGDELKKTSSKPVNYTSIAIKGLLRHYQPTNATIIVDGQKHTYSNVWLAPTMYGKYYGGGMIPAPQQKRCPGGPVSVMAYHHPNKLKTLQVFPSIFKGEHIKHTDMVEILSGHTITVEFDSPRPLQIDGETIADVRSYTVSA